MPKKENAEFLASICMSQHKFPKSVYDAMLTWLFGDERTIEVCAKKAYKDIQRKPLEGIGNMPERDKLKWRVDIEKLITRCIDDLLTLNIPKQEAFDAWHRKTCEEICEVSMSNEHNVQKWLKNGFTYGNAQKWLNITIKNMLTMELWDDKLEPIRKHLHVPVDDYIMEAASDNLGIKIISKPWSRWDYSDYIRFQEELRKAVESQCPMDWEFEAWNKIKDERKNK